MATALTPPSKSVTATQEPNVVESDNPLFHCVQANPLKIVFTLPDGFDFTDATHFVVEIHDSRTNHTVLANLIEEDPTGSEYTAEWSHEQLNISIPTDDLYRDLWMVAFALYPIPDGATSAELKSLGGFPFRLWSDAASASVDAADPTPLWALASDLAALEETVENLTIEAGVVTISQVNWTTAGTELSVTVLANHRVWGQLVIPDGGDFIAISLKARDESTTAAVFLASGYIAADAGYKINVFSVPNS